ncbi:hypothetical protein [Duganella sp. Root198D2]|uniref:DUF6916 family protein n=1 Tax=Duganella sp. Root198D2 TaxID=1736489 RepID=UPI0007091CBB|nr:hypothetical protein [Duganella sp. Root198D2]KRC01475.1 hypothetical protein ASE26_20855 [Duganella sp. Root198D2]
MERRNFILAAGTLVGAPAVARAASLAALPPSASTLRMAGFRDLVGQQFIAFQGKRGTSLDLLAVRGGKEAPHQEQFTLLFTGAPWLDAGIYEIDNPLSGRMSIFMEPAGRGPAAGLGALYRAEFSLLV